MNTARSWVVWSAAVFAYIVAVLQRTSLGVAGVEATQRFELQATALSTLAVVQLAVYAALQIPIGVLLDRIGPKPLIAVGALLMALGQAALAEAPNAGVAIVARILVGAGDACTFISVIRLLPAWFSGRILPQVSQWTGTLGLVGQVLSAVPFAALLHAAGWSPAFLALSGLSVLALAAVLLIVGNGVPPQTTGSLPVIPVDAARHPVRAALAQLRAVVRRPGTQLGFWSHFVAQSSGTVLSLLWGVPFLSVALGYGQTAAAALLVVPVLAGVVSGPLLGLLSARFPMRRSNLVLGIVAVMGVIWTLVLAWPGPPPVWLVIVLLVAVGVGGPGSLIGFDFARTFNPRHALGSASGIVNVGGFSASVLMTFLIGLVLDVLARAAGSGEQPTALYTLDHFRIAFCVQYLVVGGGVLLLLRARRRTRRRLQEDEGITVGPLWVALLVRLRRKSA